MRQLAELGIRPLKRREPPFRAPSAEEVASFEAAFDAKLPVEYVDLLRQFNGGRPTINAFTTGSGYTCAIGLLFYLLPEDPSRIDRRFNPDGGEFGNLWAETRDLREAVVRNRAHPGLADKLSEMTDRVVPFAYDTGNASQFVFDLRPPRPAVCLAVAEHGFSLVRLADSFAAFIDSLHELGDD